MIISTGGASRPIGGWKEGRENGGGWEGGGGGRWEVGGGRSNIVERRREAGLNSASPSSASSIFLYFVPPSIFTPRNSFITDLNIFPTLFRPFPPD